MLKEMVSKSKKNNVAERAAFENTRKTLRKQKRQQKKIHRRDHYLKKKNSQPQDKYVPGKFVRRPVESPELNAEKKKRKLQPSVHDIIAKERQKEKNEAEHLKSQMEMQRKKMLLKANEDEDKVIKKLEKHLGLNKTKNKNNYFTEDGLDYLLEICDRTTSEQIVAAEKHLADIEGESDFEEDLAVVTGKEGKEKNKKDKDKLKTKAKSKHNQKLSDEESINSDEEDKNSIEESEDKDSIDLNNDDDNVNSDDAEDSDEDLSSESIGDDDSNKEELDDDSDSPEQFKEKTIKTKSKSDTKQEVETVENKSKKRKIENKLVEKKSKKQKIVSENDLSKVFTDDEISHLSGDEDAYFNEDEKDEKSNEKPDVWEDIYGRKRDKEGNVIKEEKGVYIPPHLRNKDSTSDQEMMQLTREIKSVLNKVSRASLHWACSSVEALYGRHSRHAVSSALFQRWAGAALAGGAPPRTLAEYAALVAVLHANVATEIGAHFLQELTKKFDELMRTPQPVEDKTLDNLISSLSHLYCFKIYHANLLYDILSRLLEDITEKNIECILVALRCVGGVLRKEEPLALKNFIHDTQARVANISESAANGSRVKFLLEVLLAVKNNNLSKIPNYDPSYVEQLRKAIKGIIRKGNYVTTLNIRLEDLLKADERGKWWIVGSAWESSQVVREERPGQALPPPTADLKLLELARAQRMNTDVRRTIFCVIMAAEDFMDAFEKLQRLGLRGQQEREIVHVLLACCLSEIKYNPYYSVLAQKLCDFDRKYQLSIQFSVWDKIKELESLSKKELTNLAQFLIHLIMGKGLPLSVLKVIQFSDLNKSLVRFMRQILLAIIMNVDFEASLEVFHRISKSQKLHSFRESLNLFIQHFLIKNADKKNNILSEEMATLKMRAQEVNKILRIRSES